MAPTLTGLQQPPAVAIVSGAEVGSTHYRDILAILSQNWANADPYLHDFARVMRNCGRNMLVRLTDGRVDGVLRTNVIRSWGSPHSIPRSFEELVGPYWSRRERFGDTRILVDLTKRDDASSVARSLIAASLETFHEPHVVTFSPEDRAALHTRFGAYPVGRIEHGRPRHSSPHVILMCYRGFAGYPPRRLAGNRAA